MVSTLNSHHSPVQMDSPGANVRRVSCSITIRRHPEAVWKILTDYDNLADHVPGLGKSQTLHHREEEGIRRLYQVSEWSHSYGTVIS